MAKKANCAPLILAICATLPGIFIKLAHLAPSLNPIVVLLLTGMAILGASFLLTWACEVAQLDIPPTLALAIVAFIAVLPEYAVDMYFTFMAGQHPESSYAHYAIANMTGANRILIGIGWSAVVILYFIRHRKTVFLQPERRTELLFLGIASLYAFVIPLKGSLAWYDAIILISIYVFYIKTISKHQHDGEEELEGTAAILANFVASRRRKITASLFLYSALVILACAEPFSESLIASGKILHINEFLLVQWLAPVASESPEFIVALIFAWRGRANLALGSLLSSKLNQWTLLVGMIPIVYAFSAKTLAHPIPMDSHQMNEILLTAAQSIFGLAIILSLRLGFSGALVLLLLFALQFTAPLYEERVDTLMGWSANPERLHQIYSSVYISLAAVLLVIRRKMLARLV